jgi:hypothetical protein
MLFGYFTLSLLIAIILALLEIQIEGKHGWAGRLPTWKILLPNRTTLVTGYHFYLMLFFISACHLVFIFIPWQLKTELLVLSLVIYTLLIEDFFWFALNPHFGLSKFAPKFIPWHKHWLGPLPTTYYLNLVLWFILFSLSLS